MLETVHNVDICLPAAFLGYGCRFDTIWLMNEAGDLDRDRAQAEVHREPHRDLICRPKRLTAVEESRDTRSRPTCAMTTPDLVQLHLDFCIDSSWTALAALAYMTRSCFMRCLV